MGRIVWPIPISDKLATLAACGIKRKRGVSVLDIARANVGGRLEAGEPVSYLNVVERLGFERATRPHNSLSDNVHFLDAKCVRKPSVYTEILCRMVHMARGRFPVRNISSHIDFELGKGEARFVLGATRYRMPIRVRRAWIDGNFLSSFARLLRKVDRTMRYIELSSGDDYFVIGCVTNSEMKLLRKHTDLSFAELDHLSF